MCGCSVSTATLGRGVSDNEPKSNLHRRPHREERAREGWSGLQGGGRPERCFHSLTLFTALQASRDGGESI